MHSQSSFDRRFYFVCSSLNHFFVIKGNQIFFGTLVGLQLYDSIDEIRSIEDAMIKALSTIYLTLVSDKKMSL